MSSPVYFLQSLIIKHIIFDWSGTLFDDHAFSYLATKQTINHFSKKKISLAEYKKHFTIPVENFYRRYTKTPWEEIDRYYFDAYQQHFFKGKLFADVLDLLKELKRQKIKVSILSTVRQDLLDEICRRLNFTSYFCFIQGSAHNKTQALAQHLKQIKADQQTTIFVGDTEHDIEAAHSLNLMSGCVLNGYHDLEQMVKHQPRFVWNDQKDILAFVKSLNLVSKKKAADKPIVTVGALVFNSKKQVFLVLTHKWSYTYGIPGGKIEKGELAVDAVIRELKEETGMKIIPGKLVLVQDCIDSNEFYRPNSHFILMNYYAKTHSTKFKLNDEAQSGLWILPELALNLKLNRPTRLLIQECLKESRI